MIQMCIRDRCIFVGWIWKPAAVIEEVEKGGKFKFTWKKIFTFLIRYICPIITLIVVLSSIGIITLYFLSATLSPSLYFTGTGKADALRRPLFLFA